MTSNSRQSRAAGLPFSQISSNRTFSGRMLTVRALGGMARWTRKGAKLQNPGRRHRRYRAQIFWLLIALLLPIGTAGAVTFVLDSYRDAIVLWDGDVATFTHRRKGLTEVRDLVALEPGRRLDIRATDGVRIFAPFHAKQGSFFMAQDTECGIPSYEPDYWNDLTPYNNGNSWCDDWMEFQSVQQCNNCYAYANNKRVEERFARPGAGSGGGWPAGWGIEEIRDLAEGDGLVKVEPVDIDLDDVECPDNMAVVAIALWPLPDGTFHDHHWYRRDADAGGRWSHKHGDAPARDLDEADQPIYDPKYSTNTPYTTFAGYMCTCSSEEQGMGHELIR